MSPCPRSIRGSTDPSVVAWGRDGLVVVIVTLTLAAGGCRPCHRASHVDLIQGLPAARTRALLPSREAVAIVQGEIEGSTAQSLRTCGPTRIIWTACLPRQAVLRTRVARDPVHSAPGARLGLRIGVSGKRRYDVYFHKEYEPTAASAGAAWTEVAIRLSRYTDFQWSLFYRPWELPWEIVFSTDSEVVGGRGACGLWEAPRLESAEQ